MTIDRLTRQRLFTDETLFNELLPFAKYDEEFQLFVHVDASIWSIWELEPVWITKASDSDAFHLCDQIQELVNSLDERTSIQVNWISTFDVQDILKSCLEKYPTSGVAGWMARRWVKGLQQNSKMGSLNRRPRKLRLMCSFKYNPPWKAVGAWQQLIKSFKMLFSGNVKLSSAQRKAEYVSYANHFRGLVDSKIARLFDLGFRPKRVNGQDLINIMYPLLNRSSVKSGKYRRGRSNAIPIPEYDPQDLLSNQLSETGIDHIDNGLIKKDGRVYRTVSLAKPPKTLLPLMITSLQGLPYESIISVTISKDSKEKQLARLDRLDSTLGFREFTGRGRANQKVQHQITTIRAARNELYNDRTQLVRVGVHQTFICQNEDEARRASAEALSTFPQLYGARGMVHEISDLAGLINSLPGCYDPTTDGTGWTNVYRSSRGVRLLPLWGNWKGSEGTQFVLPCLWNRELIGFDLYDSNIAPNVLVSGVSGSGKSYLLCYMIITLARGHYSLHSSGNLLEKPPIIFVFDKGMANQPCGFEKLAKLFGGRIYEATPSKAPPMNFLARLGKTPADARNEDYKDLLDICADVIMDMGTEGNKNLERLDRISIIDSLIEAHHLYRNWPMAREFILSDVVASLRAPKRVEENEDDARRRQKIAMLIADFYGDGTYARFFDRPGALELEERFIVFDLKTLSRNPDLQRVFLKVAMLWADLVMNDPNELDSRKILVFDEAHDLIGKSSSSTIETAFRMYRKRKGMVIAASQSGEDFYGGAGGQAIVQNSAHKIFLRQDPSKFHVTSRAFNLTDQQSDVIMRLKTVKGLESQFYLVSDIGEGAFVLPVEPSFYWASTNNGDDNQLFHDVLQEVDGNYWAALERLVHIAPSGAAAIINNQETNSEQVKPGFFTS